MRKHWELCGKKLKGKEMDRFIDNNDGTVTDITTDLMWQKETGKKCDWEEANSYCEELRLAGHKDWRLPTIQELQGIVDYSRSSPAINPIFHIENSHYWSSTTIANDSYDAWNVNFNYGHVGYGYKSGYRYVRAVRYSIKGGEMKLTIELQKINEEDGGGYNACIPELGRYAVIGGGEDPLEAITDIFKHYNIEVTKWFEEEK